MNLRYLFFLLLLSLYACSSEVEESEYEKPNILIITVDDLTAKYIGAFGSELTITPNIDGLGKQGVVFQNAVTQAAMCTPSRNSILTAQYPHNLGLYHNLDLKKLEKGIWNFPKAVKELGYTTYFIGKNHLIPNNDGINAANNIEFLDEAMKNEFGFDIVRQSKGRTMVKTKALREIKTQGYWERGQDIYGDYLDENGLLDKFLHPEKGYISTLDPDSEYQDGFYTNLATEELSHHNNSNPFMMWLNYSGPHFPFDAPKKFQKKMKQAEIPKPIGGYNVPNDIPHIFQPHPNPYKSEGKFDVTLEYRRRYLSAIAQVDYQIGRMLRYLKKHSLLENTVIIFFSDHGIMLGDHCLIEKETLYNEVLNSGLIINWNKRIKAKKVRDVIEILDVAKTVIDLAGGEQEDLSKVPNGHSLVPFLFNEDKFTGPGVGFSETRNFRSITTSNFKFVDIADSPILFDLKNDPQETINYAKDKPEVVKELKNQLDEWLINTPPVLAPKYELINNGIE